MASSRPRTPLPLILAGIVVPLALIALEQFSFGEFLKTGPGVYQSTGKRAKVILSQEQPGIFIVFGPPTELQIFNPSDIKKDPSIAHVFLRYDPQINRYTALSLGKKDYRIGGSFTLLLGDLRVTVDNTNPYCSIVLDKPGPSSEEPAILGLLGLSVIVNNTGQQAVALLEANQLSQYKGVLNPYTFRSGELFVKEQPLRTAAVGVSLDQKNPCLSTGAVVLARKDLDHMAELKTKESIREFMSVTIAAARKKPLLQGQLKLRVTPDSIIVLDPIKGDVKVVKKASLSSGDMSICSIDEVKF